MISRDNGSFCQINMENMLENSGTCHVDVCQQFYFCLFHQILCITYQSCNIWLLGDNCLPQLKAFTWCVVCYNLDYNIWKHLLLSMYHKKQSHWYIFLSPLSLFLPTHKSLKILSRNNADTIKWQSFAFYLFNKLN